MSTRPRGRSSESLSPIATRGAEAVDDYLVALEDAELLDPRSLAALECAFILNAKQFGDRRGVSYDAWRDVGVPVEVLAEAGIHEVVAV